MSYVKVPAEKVIKVCEARLDRIALLRAMAYGRIIRREAIKPRWCGLAKPYGYQKAYELLERCGSFSDYGMIGLRYASTENECEDLINLAKLGDPVVISLDHAYLFSETYQ